MSRLALTAVMAVWSLTVCAIVYLAVSDWTGSRFWGLVTGGVLLLGVVTMLCRESRRAR